MYRPQPLWVGSFKALFWAAVAVLALTGCATTSAGPQGFKTTNTNITSVSWTPNSFTATGINASTPLNSTWRGVNKLANTIATGAIGIAVPGSGVVPAITRGGAILAPNLTPTPADVILTK